MNLPQIWILIAFATPGFAIAFLISRYRSRYQPNLLKTTLWAALVGVVSSGVVCGGLVATFLYMTRDRETDHFEKPLTVQEARQSNCPIPLPDEAHNVQFATTTGGMVAYEALVRFEAQVAVCKKQAQVVFDDWSQRMGKSSAPLPFRPLTRGPTPEDHDMLGRATWFDVERIDHGLSSDDANNLRVWIDEDRGVFYCKITD